MTTALTPSTNDVYEYHWVKGVPCEPTEGPADQAYWVLTRQDPLSTPTKTYSPLQEFPGLFKTFAEITPTREGISRFASRYGMLGSPLTRQWKPEWEEFYGEWLWDWQEHILGVKSALEVLTALEHRDVSTLRRVFSKWMEQSQWIFPDYNPLPSRDDFPRGPALEDEGWSFDERDGENIPKVRHSFGKIVTAALKGHLSATIVPNAKGSFDFFMVPDSLISAIWYQVAQSAMGDKDFRRCERPGCDQWIEISLGPTGSKSSIQYCSHSCQMKAYRARQKEAQELKRQGKSPRDIAQALGSTVATVRKWTKKRSRTRPTKSP